MPKGCAKEADKARYIDELSKEAGTAYSKILTRYPIMDRADDAKKRLAALHQPIPRPTKAAVALNKAEEASRREASIGQKLMAVVKKGPDTSRAAKIGEPLLIDPTPVSARDVQSQQMKAIMDAGRTGASLEIVKPEDAAANATDSAASGTTPEGTQGTAGFRQPAAPNSNQPVAADPNELKPNVTADPNELKPIDSATGQPLPPPPPQVNEIQQGQNSPPANAAVSTDNSAPASDQEISSRQAQEEERSEKDQPVLNCMAADAFVRRTRPIPETPEP